MRVAFCFSYYICRTMMRLIAMIRAVFQYLLVFGCETFIDVVGATPSICIVDGCCEGDVFFCYLIISSGHNSIDVHLLLL